MVVSEREPYVDFENCTDPLSPIYSDVSSNDGNDEKKHEDESSYCYMIQFEDRYRMFNSFGGSTVSIVNNRGLQLLSSYVATLSPQEWFNFISCLKIHRNPLTEAQIEAFSTIIYLNHGNPRDLEIPSMVMEFQFHLYGGCDLGGLSFMRQMRHRVQPVESQTQPLTEENAASGRRDGQD